MQDRYVVLSSFTAEPQDPLARWLLGSEAHLERNLNAA